MSSPAFLHRRETRQRERLATLVDAVFAVVLVVLVIERPFPEGSSAGGGSIWAFLSIHKQALVAALIGACCPIRSMRAKPETCS